MVRGKHWIQISYSTFMKDLVPAPVGQPFKKSDHNLSLDLEHLDVASGDAKREKQCYPTLVSILSPQT